MSSKDRINHSGEYTEYGRGRPENQMPRLRVKIGRKSPAHRVLGHGAGLEELQ
jgi:hypothetical protein